MAEIRWHIIDEEGNPKEDGTYLITKRLECSDGEYDYYATCTMEYADGWNCYKTEEGDVIRKYEIKEVYAWANIFHLYCELPQRKEKDE